MHDQADRLRTLATTTRFNTPGRLRLAKTRTIAVTSGKGGVGKTNLVVNLAIAMAKMGRRVTVLDADLGTANIDVVMGLRPTYNLQHVVAGQVGLSEIMVEGPHNIRIIPGGSGLWELANLEPADRLRLVESLSVLDGTTDILLIDTGAGISANIIQFVLASREVIVITSPEPTAIADAYAVVKVASQASTDMEFKLVVNFARDGQEASWVSDRIKTVARQFLQVEIEYCGFLPIDENLPRAVRRQIPFMVAYPSSPASIKITALGRNLLENGPAEKNQDGVLGFFRRMAGSPC